MLIYIDSSALVKLFVDEPGSPEMKTFIMQAVKQETNGFVTSVVTKAEVLAAFAAMRRGRHLRRRQFEQVVADFQEQWKMYSIPKVSVALIDRSGEIGLNHKVKGCDAFQLASAVEVNAEMFISTDNDLNAAASAHGLTIWNPMQDPVPTIASPAQESVPVD